MKAIAGAGMDCSGVSLAPSHCDRPESCGQRRVVCEKRGYPGSQCRLLRLREAPVPVHTSLESSESRAAWEGRQDPARMKGPLLLLLKNSWVWEEGSDKKVGEGTEGPSWETWGLEGVKTLTYLLLFS